MNRQHPTHSSLCVCDLARRHLAIIPLVFIFAMACAFAPAARAQSNPPPQYLFTFQGDANVTTALYTYTVDPTSGQLTLTADTPVVPHSAPMDMHVNPAGTLLFTTTTTSAGSAAIGVFTIASNGSLAELAASPFGGSSAAESPFTSAVSPDGNYLYLLSYVNAKNAQGENVTNSVVDVFSIGSDGTPTVINSYTIAGMPPAAMALHPTGSWLYVFGNEGAYGHASSIEQLTVGPPGTLTDNGPFTLQYYSIPPIALTTDNPGTFLYATYYQYGGGSAGVIDSLAVNSVNGTLSIASNYNDTSDPEYSFPPNLVVDSTGNFLYSTVHSYSVSDGVVMLLDSFTPPTQAALVASLTTPFLFEVGTTPNPGSYNFLSSQVVGTNGSLTYAPGSPISTLNQTYYTTAVTGAAPVPTEPVLRASPTSASIDNVVVGQTGSSTVVVTNWGYSPLILSNVSVSGDPSLTETNTCTAPVAPMATCQATITFTPTAAGTFTGTLTLESNAPTRTVAITAMSENPYPYLVILPQQNVLIPDTALGSSSSLTIELENYIEATEPLIVSGLSWVGSNPNDFSETNNCSSPIPIGGFCSVNITFTPLALGNRAAYLNIASNAEGINQANVTGNAVTTVTKYSFSTVINGPGTVTQSPTGTSLANNTTIYLTASPSANSSFINWTGVCTNAGYLPSCTVVLNQNTVATANFVANVNLTVAVVGPGTVTQSPPGSSLAPGTTVVLIAVPNSGAQFVSWTPSGACATNEVPTECVTVVNTNTTITSTFSGPQYSLGTTVVGPGTIQQSPSGTSFNPNTSITLTAVPNANSTFTSWSGACAASTNPVCTFTINANTSVTATFTANPAVTPTQTTQTGSAGSTFTFQFNDSGFSAAPTLTAACSIPAGGCSVSGLTVTVTTTARPAAGALRTPPDVNAPPALRFKWPIASLGLSLALLLILTREFSPAAIALRSRRIFSAAALVGGLALFAACGGSNGGGTPPPPGTPAGTYNVTVTATAGGQTATSTVSVVVQ